MTAFRGSTLAEQVRELVAPLATGTYVSDWAERARGLATLVDLSAPSAREDAYWAPESAIPRGVPLSLSPTRAAVIAASDGPDDGAHHVSLNLDFGELQGVARRLVADATVGLDAAEKIVISAAAWSLCELPNPPELVLDVMNIVYEEALHLEAVGRLVGTDHAEHDWIPVDRRVNWELVCQCETPLDYMVLEHCLYEGRGTVASAAGAFQLERAGTPPGVVDVFAAISRQEANHNISGFRWLKLLDSGGERHQRRLAEIVRRFLDAEPLPEQDGSARSQRKHFPLYLVDCYRRSSDFYVVKQEIVSASRAARRTGLPGVPVERLYAAARDTARWSEIIE
jgi:hypothetical protein